MTFFQVDRGVFTSSVWISGTPEEKVLWFWLLGNCNDLGVVPFRELAIADGTKLPRASVDAALEKFSQPDPDSKTRDNEGRRISRTDEGFVRILNREIYYSKDYSTPRWRKWKDRQRANALANGPTPFTTKDKDKDKKKDLSTQDRTSTQDHTKSESHRAELRSDSDSVTPKNGKSGASSRKNVAEDTARRYVAVLDAVTGRRTRKLSPDVVSAVRQRLRDWQPWQIIGVPVLVFAQGRRDRYSPDVFLRDGSHPRTRDGNTHGAYYWLSRTYESADGTRLDGRLVSIAEQAGVLDQLRSLGVVTEGVA